MHSQASLGVQGLGLHCWPFPPPTVGTEPCAVQACRTSSQNKWGLNKPVKNSKSSEGFRGTRGPGTFQVKKQVPQLIPKGSRLPNAKPVALPWGAAEESVSVRLLCPETVGRLFCLHELSHLCPFSVAKEGSVGDERDGATPGGKQREGQG